MLLRHVAKERFLALFGHSAPNSWLSVSIRCVKIPRYSNSYADGKTLGNVAKSLYGLMIRKVGLAHFVAQFCRMCEWGSLKIGSISLHSRKSPKWRSRPVPIWSCVTKDIARVPYSTTESGTRCIAHRQPSNQPATLHWLWIEFSGNVRGDWKWWIYLFIAQLEASQ